MLLSFCCQATCLPGDLSARLAKPNVLLETRICCEHAFAECGLTIVHGQDSSKLPGCEQQIFRRRLFGQKANLLSKAHAHFGLAIRNCCFFMVDVCRGCRRRAWRHSDADLVCALTPFGCTPLVGFCAAPCGPSWISSAITGPWVLKVGALSTVFATSTRHGQAIMNRPILTFSMCWNARRSKPPS